MALHCFASDAQGKRDISTMNIEIPQSSLQLTRADFPDKFEFGIATSSYQIEGSSFGGCGKSHWDTFAATPGKTVRGEDGSIACDHYHRWAEDLDLISNCGFDSYRFSVSWARVMPEGRGKVNAEGLDFYERLVDGMLERGINPYLTLYHWELPPPLRIWAAGKIATSQTGLLILPKLWSTALVTG